MNSAFKLVQELVGTQIELNNGGYGLKDVWRQGNGYSYRRKAIQEAVEMLDHIDDNWWKKTDFNARQVHFEIIDVLHFLLSEYAQQDYLGMLPPNAESLYWAEFAMPENKLEDVQYLSHADRNANHPWYSAHATLLNTLTEGLLYVDHDHANVPMPALTAQAIIDTLNLAYLSGLDIDKIKALYIGKTALNEIRQQNGYKQGTYHKIWPTYVGHNDNRQEVLVEDNVVLYNIVMSGKIPEYEGDLTLRERIMSDLACYYADPVQPYYWEKEKEAE